TKVINKLIFTGNDGVSGYRTWESDGSASGTTIAKGIGDPGDGTLQELVETDNFIFASIRDTVIGRELWAISYSSVLPLELLDFRGLLKEENAVLYWKTSNEENTDLFEIERSLDGNHFSLIGRQASYNTPGEHDYQFTDAGITRLNAGLVYYRL